MTPEATTNPIPITILPQVSLSTIPTEAASPAITLEVLRTTPPSEATVPTEKETMAFTREYSPAWTLPSFVSTQGPPIEISTEENSIETSSGWESMASRWPNRQTVSILTEYPTPGRFNWRTSSIPGSFEWRTNTEGSNWVSGSSSSESTWISNLEGTLLPFQESPSSVNIEKSTETSTIPPRKTFKPIISYPTIGKTSILGKTTPILRPQTTQLPEMITIKSSGTIVATVPTRSPLSLGTVQTKGSIILETTAKGPISLATEVPTLPTRKAVTGEVITYTEGVTESSGLEGRNTMVFTINQPISKGNQRIKSF